MFREEAFSEDLLCSVIVRYSLKRESFVVFLNSVKEWKTGFFKGFSLVSDLSLPSSSIIFTPAAIPLLF